MGGAVPSREPETCWNHRPLGRKASGWVRSRVRLTRGRLLRAWITGQDLAERTCVHTAPPQSSLLVGLRSPLPGLTVPRERRHGEGGLEKGKDVPRARAGAVREHSAFQRGGARVRRGTRSWAQSTCHCAQLLLRKPRSELPWLSGSAVQRTTGWTSSPGVTYSDILARVHHCGLPGGHGAGVSQLCSPCRSHPGWALGWGRGRHGAPA